MDCCDACHGSSTPRNPSSPTKTVPRVLPSAEWTASALRFTMFTWLNSPAHACRLATTGAWFTENVVGSPLFLPGLSPGNMPPVSLAHPPFARQIAFISLRTASICVAGGLASGHVALLVWFVSDTETPHLVRSSKFWGNTLREGVFDDWSTEYSIMIFSWIAGTV